MGANLTDAEWLAIREAEGMKIRVEDAMLTYCWGYVLDPYDLGGLPKECRCSGRLYFARRPESDIWVSFYDLPSGMADKLHEKMRQDPACQDAPDGGLWAEILRAIAKDGKFDAEAALIRLRGLQHTFQPGTDVEPNDRALAESASAQAAQAETDYDEIQ